MQSNTIEGENWGNFCMLVALMLGPGRCQEFSDGRLTFPTRELKYGQHCTVDGTYLRHISFSPSDGVHSPLNPPLVLPLDLGSTLKY